MNSTTDRPHRTAADLSRRSVLAVGAAGVGAVTLAACSKAKSADNPGTTVSSAGSTAGSSSASSGGGATASASASASASSGGSNETVLAKLSDVPVGGALSAQDAKGQPILIVQPTANDVKAFSAICPHQGCTVANSFVCPCHQSTFDKTSGSHLSGPARSGLTTVAVKVSGANIVAG